MTNTPLKQHDEKAWFEQALTALSESGSTGQACVEYITQRGLRFGFCPQKYTGACWFDWRRLRFGVFLNNDYANKPPNDPWLCSLLAHEAKHVEQGLPEALSVRGELVAWQLQYDILTQFSAEPAADAWQDLRALSPDSRGDLSQAQTLMKRIGGPGYHIDWLPFWPLPAEVVHRLKGFLTSTG